MHIMVAAHQLAMSTSGMPGAHQHRGGLDFYTLARGAERSYSCSFLVNLDPDLLTLCSREDATTLDLARANNSVSEITGADPEDADVPVLDAGYVPDITKATLSGTPRPRPPLPSKACGPNTD